MGTRNLTCVVADGKYKIAQYGHMDGDPQGLGYTILRFAAANLKDHERRARFKKIVNEQVKSLRFDQINEAETEPEIRAGGLLLDEINALTESQTMLLEYSLEFAGESLHCEWAYVLDLDNNILEVFKGLNQAPLSETERFAHLPISRTSSEYKQIKLSARFKLDALPSFELFSKMSRRKQVYRARGTQSLTYEMPGKELSPEKEWFQQATHAWF